MAKPAVILIRDFFGPWEGGLTAFKAEWAKLTQADRAELAALIEAEHAHQTVVWNYRS
jgi:hypothetical protein